MESHAHAVLDAQYERPVVGLAPELGGPASGT